MSPFQIEMRRRLWYSICVLDMQAAFDEGSRPTIANNASLGSLPLCIDDANISPSLPDFPVELKGFTDMSFSSMMYGALSCWRKLTHVPTSSEGQPGTVKQDWKLRSRIVRDWEQRHRKRHLQYFDTSQPLQLFCYYVGEGMIITMRLLERRPLHGFYSGGPPPANDYDVLKVATEVLQASLVKSRDRSLDPWG